MEDEKVIIKNVRVEYITTKTDKFNNEICYLTLKDKNIDVIVAFSTQGILNKIFAFILGHKDAHYGTKTKPIEEEKILLEECDLIKKINFFGLFKILKLKFKEI